MLFSRRWFAGLFVTLALCVTVVAQPLPGLFNPLLQGPAIPPSIVFTDSDSTTTDNTTYTFTSQAIGTAATGRLVVVAISFITDPDSTNSWVSGTIGGVTAALVVQRAEAAASASYSALMSAVVPTGTTATVVFTLASTVIRGGIGVWALYDLASTTAVATTSSLASPGVLNLNVTTGDVGIGAAYVNSTSGFTWAGATEDYDVLPGEGAGIGGASFLAASTETPRTISVTYGSASKPVSVSAVWR